MEVRRTVKDKGEEERKDGRTDAEKNGKENEGS